jgi:hypothetical protein
MFTPYIKKTEWYTFSYDKLKTFVVKYLVHIVRMYLEKKFFTMKNLKATFQDCSNILKTTKLY